MSMSTDYATSFTPTAPSNTVSASVLTPSTTISSTFNPATASPSPLRQAQPAPSPLIANTFAFPRAYSFPPFFTRQPVLQTHHAQLQKWSSLILSYCRHHRIWKLSLSDAIDTPLFHNKQLGKRLSREDAKEVLEFMRGEGRAEWIGKGEGEAWIWWRNVDEWAGVLYDWIDETAQKNTVLTLYELTESEATISQEFHSMDADLLQKALAVLVKRGKAQVFGQEDQQGVKFF